MVGDDGGSFCVMQKYYVPKDDAKNRSRHFAETIFIRNLCGVTVCRVTDKYIKKSVFSVLAFFRDLGTFHWSVRQ